MSKAMQLKAKIKNIATENHIPAQAVLQNYMLERLLERIVNSNYKNQFIVKGGMLIASMVGISNRTTMDVDATLYGYPLSEETIHTALTEICAIQLDDNVTFVLNHITPIRDDDQYGGFRASIITKYESIITPLKMDITTGDIITPKAIRYTFKSFFEDKEFKILAYNIETILAEKVETILRRSVLNTRPRDFYDVYIISRTYQHKINKKVFKSALRATSERRKSILVIQDYKNILMTIQSDITMIRRWKQYCNDYYYAKNIDFNDAINILMELLN